MRMPLRRQNRELATPGGEKPPTHATINLRRRGISAPFQKIPPRSTSEPPPPPSDDTALPTDPPNALCLLGASQRGRALHQNIVAPAGRKNSFRPIDLDKSTHFPFPPAPRASAETATQHFINVSRIERRAPWGGTRRQVIGLFFTIFYSSYFYFISRLPPLIPSSIFFLPHKQCQSDNTECG